MIESVLDRQRSPYLAMIMRASVMLPDERAGSSAISTTSSLAATSIECSSPLTRSDRNHAARRAGGSSVDIARDDLERQQGRIEYDRDRKQRTFNAGWASI